MQASTNQSPFQSSTRRPATLQSAHYRNQVHTHALLPASVYRRRRIMAGVALFGALLTAFVSTQTADATSSMAKPKLSYVTVYSGESLWQIAERVAPNTDPRDFINAVMQINALRSPELSAGQRLIMPGQ